MVRSARAPRDKRHSKGLYALFISFFSAEEVPPLPIRNHEVVRGISVQCQYTSAAPQVLLGSLQLAEQLPRLLQHDAQLPMEWGQVPGSLYCKSLGCQRRRGAATDRRQLSRECTGPTA